MAVTLIEARHNLLLAAMPEDELQHWLQHLEFVDMPLGKVLCESGVTAQYMYFPSTAVIALFYQLLQGESSLTAIVGKEGMLGFSLFMGGGSTPSRAVVVNAGKGFRLHSQPMLREFELSGGVMHLLLRYTQALITEVSQNAVCNKHHSVSQQFCRLLLILLDRVEGRDLPMTHELIANMLGIRRESVTGAAIGLQRAGTIRYHRGRITVLDRPAIESRACECYAVVKLEYERLLPQPQPQPQRPYCRGELAYA